MTFQVTQKRHREEEKAIKWEAESGVIQPQPRNVRATRLWKQQGRILPYIPPREPGPADTFISDSGL